ncbi:MAG: leucine-rich repeat protein, partial [Muribaculaceae bacterium]|nr:leucine-rich repeat protein [Muribaculaceae bacterium]
MKNLITSALLLLALLLPATATAHDFEVDGIYYNINGNEATVTYDGSYYTEYSGSVVIPATVTYNGTTYSVTAIGIEAFAGCRDLTSIVIPNSVTSIGKSAFYYC